jgi:phospholipid N-methyltransferase
MSEHLQFLKAFARNPAKVGAIAPSSPRLASAMVNGLSLNDEQSIVEFGPGTGPFTEAIRGVLAKHDNYIGIERDPKFIGILRDRFPQVNFIEGSAEHAKDLHQEAGIPPVKAILCGLPFASLPPSVQDGVIASLDHMMQPGTQFRTFQYVHAYPLPTAIRFRKQMSSLFGKFTRSRAVLRNLPPAYVLRWER